MNALAVALHSNGSVQPRARRRSPGSACVMCSALLARASTRGAAGRAICGGCAERLELELTLSDSAACPDCGRHRELCDLMPCRAPLPELKGPKHPPEHAPLITNVQRHQVSGAERVRAIERLAATRLGVRELGRRTGFAPSTISRWLKIDRCPPLKMALQTEVLDIGRAKLLADAPETALAELIPLAAAVSRADLARRIAALRAQRDSETCVVFGSSADSRRLTRAVRLVEAVTNVEANDRLTLQRLQTLVDSLLMPRGDARFSCAEHTSF
jgi:hypothetical protein